MELTFLLTVLASLQIFPSLVSPTAPLSAPTLSLHPPHPEFLEGERLTLRCSAPRAAEPTGYRFFDQSGERLFETPPDLYREAQLHLTVQLATTGAYSCAYWTGASGQETASEKSQPVSVQVKAHPGSWSRELALGGSFFTLNILIFLITYFLMKREAYTSSDRSTDHNEVPLPSAGLDSVPEVTSDSDALMQSEMEEPSLESSEPLEVYMEEYPPYPPPPYPSGEPEGLGEDSFSMRPPEVTGQFSLTPGKRTNVRKTGSERIAHGMRVKFNPLALLLDSSLEGEFDLVQRIIYEVEDPSLPNAEGMTALHNAVCAGHTEIVKFLVQFGVNVNAADSDGWTPLRCAASCNNVQVCKFLVESGAAVFAMTYSDMQTAADKCEEMEEGYTQCSQFLCGVQENMGIMNKGVIYALWDYEAQNDDELSMKEGDCRTILRREDEDEIEWWWARLSDKEGYISHNLLGLYPRIKPRQRSLA
ncbi:apoptosis-stimulating of p53 protein 2-like [Malaclemys terrapin pileata]|uniref:apoptosis-stimulating of p53 protein 2-like n=1 Tax=Malaclemys terrapin pileata TaxID=2991368 RepID=UPI0023A8BAE5|nr:apoptosis-stimulating of p53 protein 2-like [Malaclemys terrapin pileata]